MASTSERKIRLESIENIMQVYYGRGLTAKERQEFLDTGTFGKCKPPEEKKPDRRLAGGSGTGPKRPRGI